MKRPRDSQRSKLYGWEGSELKTAWLVIDIDNTPLGEATAQRLVNMAWKEFSRRPDTAPVVRVMRNRGRGSASYNRILLSSSYLSTQTTWYVLHELAHVIMMRSFGLWEFAVHGPEFCELYARLLDKYTAARYADVIASMKDARLKVSPKGILLYRE